MILSSPKPSSALLWPALRLRLPHSIPFFATTASLPASFALWTRPRKGLPIPAVAVSGATPSSPPSASSPSFARLFLSPPPNGHDIMRLELWNLAGLLTTNGGSSVRAAGTAPSQAPASSESPSACASSHLDDACPDAFDEVTTGGNSETEDALPGTSTVAPAGCASKLLCPPPAPDNKGSSVTALRASTLGSSRLEGCVRRDMSPAGAWVILARMRDVIEAGGVGMG
mmetsp:Transcript_46284/g.88315  ORF Transcript_46284/g.88315 Transcript_46284/m.88315 type:complete len:228 (-) Transcript_46284:809-1492(-)